MSGKNGPAHSIHLTSPRPVTVLLRRLVDMLGICVCLCAVFAHVLSQEAEEPVSITVSKRTFFLPVSVCLIQPDICMLLSFFHLLMCSSRVPERILNNALLYVLHSAQRVMSTTESESNVKVRNYTFMELFILLFF